MMLFGVVVLVVAAGVLASAQEAVAFRDRDRVAAAMDHRPHVVIAHLAAILTQDQVDALESALFPEPSVAEKVAGLGAVKRALVRLGFSETDALVEAVCSRIEQLGGGVDEVTR